MSLLLWALLWLLFGLYLAATLNYCGKPAEPEISDGLKFGRNACQAELFEFHAAHQSLYNLVANGAHPPQGSFATFATDDPYPPPGIGPYQLSARNSVPSFEGDHARGFIEVKPSKSVNQVVFEINVSSWDLGALATFNMCLLERDEVSRGFGIFTSRKGWRWLPFDRHMLDFNVMVLVPIGRYSPIVRLDTSLPNFMHSEFDAVTILGSNSGVFSESLIARNISVYTSNERVHGRFTAHNSLTLKTSNAPINVEANLLNHPGSEKATKLSVHTSNGFISTSMNLSTNQSSSSPGGYFDLDIATTNGKIGARILHVPLQSQVSLSAVTTNAPINAMVYRLLGLEDDPSGGGRSPQLRFGENRGYSEGSWYWGVREELPTSTIVLGTTNGPIDLEFI
ncbi:uncharacterized protein EI90DRAFT_3053824 [Cantharellus anzutake]|uniref:uncharacterized protein n=1 Tax=Cantharellus anzutake TaxID=1750568 RepID=UPI001907DF75|nr:uncharacterized protein EI90DRAFT_3053824 [Cantharellus anzutake]KAF8332634.1 hypothetical protein EI90DRAFT_3053824 [Cantharellus anzutake]